MKKSFYLMAVLLLGMGMVLGTSCSDDDNGGDDGNGGSGNTTEKLMPVKIRIENTTGATAGTATNAAAIAANDEVAGDDEMGGDDTGGDIGEYYGSWNTYDLTWQEGKLKLVIANTGDMATPNAADPDARVQYAFSYTTDQVVIRYSQNDFYGNAENHVITCTLNDKGYIESAKDMKNNKLFTSYEVSYNNNRLEKFRRLAAESMMGETPEWEDFFTYTYGTSQNLPYFYSDYDFNMDTYEGMKGNWTCIFGQQANNVIPNLNLLALQESAGGNDVCFVLTALAGLLPANANYIEKRTYEQQYVDFQWTQSGEQITGLNISGKITDNLGGAPVIKMTFSY